MEWRPDLNHTDLWARKIQTGGFVGEIKSTLDLVMEKTRHLTLSPEERKSQEKEENLKTIRGWIARYQDGKLTRQKVVEFVRSQKHGESQSAMDILKSELIHGIELQTDTEALFELLKSVWPEALIDIKPIKDQFADAIATASEKHRQQISDQLEREYGISGSAVVVNFEADSHWKQAEAEIVAAFFERLQQTKGQLLKNLPVFP